MNLLPWQRRSWDQFSAALRAGRLPHALLLSGPEGIGLEEFALEVARALLCDRPGADGGSCGECRACVLTHAGTHPDILRVAPEAPGKQIKVDEIRSLLEFMHLSSQSGRSKAAIITPAEAMNRSAANGLLKTLEEPPPGALLMLCAHQPGRLPVTIRSRCQQLEFAGRVDETARQWLANRLGVPEPDAEALLVRAGGAPLRAVRLHEEGILAKQGELLEDLCALRRAAANPVPIAQKWAGLGFPEVLLWLQEILRGAVACRLGQGSEGNLSSEIGNLQQIANELDLSQLVASHDLALKQYQAATGTITFNSQGLLEDFIVHWQSIAKARRR